MNIKIPILNLPTAGFCLALASVPLTAFAAENDTPVRTPAPAASADRRAGDRSVVDKVIASWPERPRLGAQQMLASYGVPQEVTTERVVWHRPGPYKRITVTKSEDHHDFPLPHMDYIEHTIDYRVPGEKADELMKFDGSVTFDKTEGNCPRGATWRGTTS
jgi:hypothetical protein